MLFHVFLHLSSKKTVLSGPDHSIVSLYLLLFMKYLMAKWLALQLRIMRFWLETCWWSNSPHDCMALHCTDPFIIIHPSSPYDFSNVERDVKHQNMCHLMTKPTKWHAHLAKTQISLGIHPFQCESVLSP